MCFVTVGVAARRAGLMESEAKFVWCFVFISPTMVCVYITMDMATSKVGQTDTETRYVLYFAIVTCCV